MMKSTPSWRLTDRFPIYSILSRVAAVVLVALVLLGSARAQTPPGWTTVGIGGAASGSASLSAGVYTVNGAGADIWGFSDSFQYLYQSLTGDGAIIAKVVTIQNTNAWAKAGIMIRSNLAVDSAYAMMSASPGTSGISFQNRLTNAGNSDAAIWGGSVPIWVKLTRVGNVFTGYQSADGVTWAQQSTATITMPSSVYVGLAVCSHVNNSTLCQATLSNVSITQATPPSSVLTPFACGPVTAGQADHFINAINAQPTWSGTAPTSAVVSDGNQYITAPWDSLQTVYIDLGAGWRTWRIKSVWTQYISGRTSAPVPFTSAWWDSTPTTAQGGTGIAETQINFGTKTHDASGSWLQDASFTTAITPPGRYLMLKTGYPTDNPCEIAFVGYRDYSGTNYAPIVNAGATQSVQFAAALQGSVSDDGIPNPPGAVTLAWSQVSGPGSVTFTSPTSLATTVSASVPGTYVLKLTANDNGTTGLTGSGNISITFAKATVTPTLAEVKAFNYSSLVLVDEVNCGNPADTHQAGMQESPAGSSQYQTILGRACRVLPNPAGAPSRYFAYRLGVGKNLQANKAYILVVEYPEDQSRQTIVINRGCETARTFYTGIVGGDAMQGPYTPGNANSMHMALSQQYRTAEMFFHLHSHYPAIMQPRDDSESGTAPRSDTPANGFLVMIGHFSKNNDPMSAGAAVARIALYEAPPLSTYTQPLTLPPNNLPKRHLFWREEMADDALKGVDNQIDWYEWKAQMAKFLGMNTYTTDLLEFGYNQGWSSAKYGNFYGPGNKWEQILYRFNKPQPAIGLPSGYGLDFLPYYEYAGSNIAGNGQLGPLKAARPLVGINSGHDYTGIWFTEGMDVDLTDTTLGTDVNGVNHPYTDVQKLLDCTIADLSGSAGGRPVPIDQPYNNTGLATNAWGYIDFGTNYANYRITQTWTNSNQFASDPASPMASAYWNNSYSGFTGGAVPAGSTAETNINFMTQPMNGTEHIWKRDMNRTISTPITPPARYLVFKSGAAISRPSQFLFVGWINGSGSTALQALPITGAGGTTGTWPYLDLSSMFNNQAPFNIGTPSFVGAWFRTRPSEIPMGFADATLARFATEANGGTAVTRAQLNSTPALLTSYINWWMGKRKAFLNSARDYLRTNNNPNAVVLYTWDATEEGAIPLPGTGQVIADDPGLWTGIATTTDYQASITNHLQLNTMTTPLGIYPTGGGQEEYKYSMPWPDVANYTANNGVMMTHTFNKPYTVSDSSSWDSFRTQSGISAIRHYCLNEDCMPTASGSIRDLLGYFVSDCDPAGPYVTLSEARAVAYGDPYYIGYLASTSFTRCSPGYVRDFNANFLALPAMTSTVVAGAANDAEVIVRKITTPSNGTFVAIVNTSLNEKLNVQITPPATGTVYDAVTGTIIPLTGGKIVLSMWAGKLKSVRIQ